MTNENEDFVKSQIYSHPKWRRRISIIVFGILAFISYTILVSINLINAKHRELESVQAQQASMSKILVNHGEATLKKIDTALLSVKLQLSAKLEELKPKSSLINAMLASHLSLISESQSLRVANKNGQFIYDASGVLHSATIFDRDYFLRNKNNPNGTLVISKPLYARITHNWVVTLSRSITDEKGDFAGLVQAAVRAEYFQNIYSSLNLGSNYSVTLFNDKLQMIARSPMNKEQLGKPISSQALHAFIKNKNIEKRYTEKSPIDGIERYYIVRKVGEYPLYIVIGHTKSDQLSQWYRQLIWSIVGMVVLGAVLIAWTIVWLRSYDWALALAQRMTSAYEKTLKHIQHLAEHDPLTNLPNRAFLENYISSIETKKVENKEKTVLLFLDLDHFKDVNDTLGHTIGDKLLVQVANRLKDNLKKEDIVSRQGGDEFAILLQGYLTLANVANTAKRLIKAIEEPFLVDDQELVISVSIGIAIYPEHGSNMESLLKSADTALYQSKGDGGGKFYFFNEDMNIQVLNRVAMISDLRQAIINKEFVLYYQPQVDGISEQIIGVEALIRWNHPKKGEICPTEFIPIAEESGLINAIGDWVLEEAALQTKKWINLGLPSLTMAVNISAVQLRQQDFIIKVMDVINNFGLEPRSLELEITESALIRDTNRIVNMLEELRVHGVRLSVDDFGTGYSSLGYLKHLPFDKIKIDQSFVRGVPHNQDDASIIKAIIGIANSLNMQTIAEGIETIEQKEFLLNKNCEQMQGFYFGKPMPSMEIEKLLLKQQN